MKITTHPGGRRVSAKEVRLVLAHARPLNPRQWAEHFGVSLRTIRTWMAEGMVLDLWAAPSASQWRTLQAEATKSCWDYISFLDGCK